MRLPRTMMVVSEEVLSPAATVLKGRKGRAVFTDADNVGAAQMTHRMRSGTERMRRTRKTVASATLAAVACGCTPHSFRKGPPLYRVASIYMYRAHRRETDRHGVRRLQSQGVA